MPIPSGLTTAEALEYVCAKLDYIEEIIAGVYPASFIVAIDEQFTKSISASTLAAASQTKVLIELAKVKDKHKNKGK